MTGFPLDPDGNGWRELCRPAADRTPRPCLFLDRDGCIVEEADYLRRVEDVVMIPGAAEAIAAANRAGWLTAIVTNQGGIGLGLFGWAEFRAVQDAILTELAARGAAIDMVLASPWHPRGEGAYRHAGHPWRKPGPGMLLAAAEDLPIDLARSWIVGDHGTDIMAGRAAGLRGGAHVLTGHGSQHREESIALATPAFEVRTIASLADATALLAG